MKDRQRNSQMQYLRKLVKAGTNFTSAHLLLFAFAIIIAFGAAMKAMHH